MAKIHRSDLFSAAIVGLLTAGPAGVLLSPISLRFFDRKTEGRAAWLYWFSLGVIVAPALAFIQAGLIGFLGSPQVTPEDIVQTARASSPPEPSPIGYDWSVYPGSTKDSVRAQFEHSLRVAGLSDAEAIALSDQLSEAELGSIASTGCSIVAEINKGAITRSGATSALSYLTQQGDIDGARKLADAILHMAETNQCTARN